MSPADLLLILPEIFQLILINILLLYALFFSGLGQKCQTSEESFFLQNSITQNKEANFSTQGKYIRLAYLSTPLQIVEPLSWLVVLSLGFSFILLLNNPSSLESAVCLTNSYICDTYASFFKALVCVSSAAAIALSIPALKSSNVGSGRSNYEFILVIYLSIMGMLCLISSYNFLTFYLSIELQSLSFYLLACSRAKSEFSAEAGLKYFILGAFSSAFLLFGMSLVYGSTGSIYFDDVAALLEFSNNAKATGGINIDLTQKLEDLSKMGHSIENWNPSGLSGFSQNLLSAVSFENYSASKIGLIIGLVCICISLLFKLAAVPFHMWAPDVYEGSPMSITAFFAIVSKIAALATLARFVIMTEQSLIELLTFVSIATLTVGTLSAMRQVKIKRLIAFSGISNVGWFLLGLCCGRLDAVMLHLIVYILTSITLFSIIIQPIHRDLGRTGESGVDSMILKHISDLGQVYKTNAVMAFALTLAFFSLGGIPILAGFYSKYLIINASIQAEALGLLTVGLISAVLSAFYYLRVVKTVYFMQTTNNWFTFDVPSLANAYLISCTTFFTAFFIAYPECLSIWLIHISL
uniref:NADH dehydrogenase subunit 2 n=1 Tax=Gloeotilopsis planctonica TaxID=34157 RepID=A0A1B2RYY1_9CHLO|nr:NADH dehydrogenase subunit 2 [Gloeotilopsis planctonica]